MHHQQPPQQQQQRKRITPQLVTAPSPSKLAEQALAGAAWAKVALPPADARCDADGEPDLGPGRRMFVDIVPGGHVDYRQLARDRGLRMKDGRLVPLRGSKKSGTAGAGAGAAAAAAEPAAAAADAAAAPALPRLPGLGGPAAGATGGTNVFSSIIEKLERQYAVDEDEEEDDDDEGEDEMEEDDEDEDDEEGDDEEGSEGGEGGAKKKKRRRSSADASGEAEDEDASGEAVDEDGGPDEDDEDEDDDDEAVAEDEAGANGGGGGANAAAGAARPANAAANAAAPRPVARRLERYDRDFIDDSEVERYKGGTRARARHHGFFINTGVIDVEAPAAPAPLAPLAPPPLARAPSGAGAAGEGDEAGGGPAAKRARQGGAADGPSPLAAAAAAALPPQGQMTGAQLLALQIAQQFGGGGGGGGGGAAAPGSPGAAPAPAAGAGACAPSPAAAHDEGRPASERAAVARSMLDVTWAPQSVQDYVAHLLHVLGETPVPPNPHGKLPRALTDALDALSCCLHREASLPSAGALYPRLEDRLCAAVAPLLAAFQREATVRKRIAKRAGELERDLLAKKEALRGGAARMAASSPAWADAEGRPLPAPGPSQPPRAWLESVEDVMAQAWDLHAMLRGAAGVGGGVGAGAGGVGVGGVGVGGAGGAGGGGAGAGGDMAPAVDGAFASELAALFPAASGVTEEELRAAYGRSRQRHAGAGGAVAGARLGSAASGGAPSPRGSAPPPGLAASAAHAGAAAAGGGAGAGAAAHHPPPVALGPRAGAGTGAGGPGTGGAAEPPSPRMSAAIRAAVAHGAPSEGVVREAWAALRPGTIGQQIFRVLCHAGPAGLKTNEILLKGNDLGFEWDDTTGRRNSLGQSMRQAASVVVAKLPRDRYALRLFPGVAQEEVARLRPGHGGGGGGGGYGGGGGGAGSGGGGGGGGAYGAGAQQHHHHQPQQHQQQHQQQAYYQQQQQQQQQQQYGGGAGYGGAAGGDDDEGDGFFAGN